MTPAMTPVTRGVARALPLVRTSREAKIISIRLIDNPPKNKFFMYTEPNLNIIDAETGVNQQ